MNTSGMLRDKKSVNARWFLIAFIFICLAGAAVSVELTRVHYLTHTEPSYNSICAINETVNCKTVAQSPYSVFAGLPVSVWGILGYVLMGVLTAHGLSSKRLHDQWPTGSLAFLALLSMAASCFLAYVSFTRISSICLFCTALYVINLSLVSITAIVLIKGKQNPIRLLVSDIRSMISKPFITSAFAVIGIGAITALLFFIEPYWQHPGWTDLPNLPTGQDENGCHWIGAKDPVVTIVEFSDYQCPFCRRAHKEMRYLAAKYPDAVKLIHSHLPLDQACNKTVKTSFHDRACEFSRAAECAAHQDKFWPMNDALFSIQDNVKAEDINIEELAVRLGLDHSSFMNCMNEKGIPGCILDDIEKARHLKVAGTPTFFVNSQPFPGSVPPDVIKNAVKRARKEHKQR